MCNFVTELKIKVMFILLFILNVLFGIINFRNKYYRVSIFNFFLAGMALMQIINDFTK